MADQSTPSGLPDFTPATFAAAEAALGTIDEALRAAQTLSGPERGAGGRAGMDQALAALTLLREIRDRLATWEPELIETARETGASWADLARPLGVASRQAAERRYLRVRPGTPGTTGEQRVRDTRDRRAADRTVTEWARGNSADLRRLAGQITALEDLPAGAGPALTQLSDALADNDASALVSPLADAHSHLADSHPDLATRIDTVTRHTDRLRQDSSDQRRTTT